MPSPGQLSVQINTHMSDRNPSTDACQLNTTEFDQNNVEKCRPAVIERFLNPEHTAATKPKRRAEVMMERLSYSVKETAASLGVHENTVWNYIRRGDLESVRVGGRRLIRVDSVRKLVGAA